MVIKELWQRLVQSGTFYSWQIVIICVNCTAVSFTYPPTNICEKLKWTNNISHGDASYVFPAESFKLEGLSAFRSRMDSLTICLFLPFYLFFLFFFFYFLLLLNLLNELLGNTFRHRQLHYITTQSCIYLSFSQTSVDDSLSVMFPPCFQLGWFTEIEYFYRSARTWSFWERRKACRCWMWQVV